MVGQSRALILLCGTLLGLLCALYTPSRALSLPGLSREHLDAYLGVHERQEGELHEETTVSTDDISTDDSTTDGTTTDVTTTDAGATGGTTTDAGATDVTSSSSESASTSEAPGTTPGVSSTAEVTTNSGRDPTDEMAAKKDIDDMDVVLQKSFVIMQEASWLENTNHTDAHANASIEATANFSSVYAEQWKEVINFYEYWNFTDPELRRRFELQAKPGTTVLSPENQTQLSSDISEMNALQLGRVCPFDKQDCDAATEGYNMDELEVVFRSERDPDALTYYWQTWRDIAGKPTKEYFVDYVGLMNMAATDDANGFADAGEMWLQPYTAPGYTTDDFKSEVEQLWEELKPLYVKLHAYVRYRLRNSNEYKDSFGENSPIPAHILGNMWAQSWENIYDIVVPYPDAPLIDISDTLNNSITDVKEMFDYAEGFFTSLGLYNMTEDFNTKSMREQPENATAVCHASAWDFLSITDKGPITDGDFRIKMCTDKNQEDFITIHHEMGHIEYQMAYSQVNEASPQTQPLIFRDGANPGFHEAIGDTIALSVSTPSHLLGLQEDIGGPPQGTATTQAPVNQNHTDINQLMRMALEKVAFVPYAYILDKFRWDVFANAYASDVYNYEWWKLRVSVQGLKPPVLREQDSDFDPGCKYHVANSVPYIRYFVATILQFQFHERLCDVGGITTPDNGVPVYQCDIYNNKKSGDQLKLLLHPGRSIPWTEQLANFMGTGDGNMTSASIKNYFSPLEEFLDSEIAAKDIHMTWDEDVDKYFVQHIPATVPIVVGIVLCAMIVVVVVAYFVGKNRNQKKAEQAKQLATTEKKSGSVNPGFEMAETKSNSSGGSGGSGGS